VRRLTLAHVDLAYELRRLIDGDLEGLTSVTVDGVVARIDLARPSQPSTAGGAAGSFELSARAAGVFADRPRPPS